MSRSAASDGERIARLGARLAAVRLKRNWTQEQLAREAGVSRPTVARLETGHSTQLTNLVRVLRALDLAENLDLLAPDPDVSPIAALERRGQPRQRASGGRGESERKPWRWGDDA